MDYKVITKNSPRWDAVAKVTGKAEFTNDIPFRNTLYAKVFRSNFAHGKVTSIDTSLAEKVPGVVKVVTYKDVPKCKFPTAGHPYSLDEGHKDIEDRNILTADVRLYGDEIAAVVAVDELTAEKAVNLIKITYEEYDVYIEPEESLKEGARAIHEWSKDNIVGQSALKIGDVEKGFSEAYYIHEGEYVTKTVQHAHMETQTATAYKDATGRYTIVSSTQIPHICRRILGQAFDEPVSNFRVIKPFIGGGFGNKQDVVIEPLVVFLSKAVGGKPVSLTLTREECFAQTRVRHATKIKLKSGFTKDGYLKSIKVDVLCTNGAYASHGHSIGAKCATIFATLYNVENIETRSRTVYTNTAAAGAMRGYGTPQMVFAMESHIEDAARHLGIDALEIRKKNFLVEGMKNPTSKLNMHVNQILECVDKGAKEFKFYEKLEESKKHKTGDFRRGVGVAAFAYATGVYPYSLEIAGARLNVNQDGKIRLFVGATEIGQGSDTVFRQMVAETVGVPYEDVIIDSINDTDVDPFDTGAYASRQTYVTGMAVKKCALQLKNKILDTANRFYEIEQNLIDVVDAKIIYKANNYEVCSLKDLSMKSYYDQKGAGTMFAEVSSNFKENSYPMGVTFCEVETDIRTGKVKILSILNVHDSGTILNPKLAEGQVEGGMGMGIGYGLLEVLKYDEKGKPLNNNLLDYKIPTFMDVPYLDVDFVEKEDPTGPYGNKGLGEPPLCSPAAAIRNAILDAIGVPVNEIPINPQTLFENIKECAK